LGPLNTIGQPTCPPLIASILLPVFRIWSNGSTAKFHVSAILGKLGATTRTEAVTRGYRLGLILI